MCEYHLKLSRNTFCFSLPKILLGKSSLLLCHSFHFYCRDRHCGKKKAFNKMMGGWKFFPSNTDSWIHTDSWLESYWQLDSYWQLTGVILTAGFILTADWSHIDSWIHTDSWLESYWQLDSYQQLTGVILTADSTSKFSFSDSHSLGDHQWKEVLHYIQSLLLFRSRTSEQSYQGFQLSQAHGLKQFLPTGALTMTLILS